MNNKAISEYFTEIISPENIIFSSAEIYASLPALFANKISSLPLAILFPGHAGELSEIMRICASQKISMRFRGGGTSLYPSQPPKDKPWIMISSSRMAKISFFSPDSRQITVQAGMTLRDLNKYLRNNSLSLPSLYGHPHSSIGGILAENVAGPEFPLSGTCASRLASLQIMTFNGSRMLLPGQNGTANQSSPEIPAAQIFCGSNGRFGAIYEATFQLSPAPESGKSFFLQGATDKIIRLLQEINNIFANEIMYLDKNCALVSGFDAKEDCVIVRLSGTHCEVENKVAKMLHIADAYGFRAKDFQGDMPLPFAIATALKTARKYKDLQEISCQPERLPALLESIHNIAEKYQLEVHIFGYPAISRMTIICCHDDEKSWELAKQNFFTLELVFGNAPDMEETMKLGREDWKKSGSGLTAKLGKLLDPDNLLS